MKWKNCIESINTHRVNDNKYRGNIKKKKKNYEGDDERGDSGYEHYESFLRRNSVGKQVGSERLYIGEKKNDTINLPLCMN